MNKSFCFFFQKEVLSLFFFEKKNQKTFIRLAFRRAPVGLSSALALFLAWTAPAYAQDRPAHVRSSGTLACAAEPRPGFAMADGEGHVGGLAVELCRAVAIAVSGPQAEVRISLPGAGADFAPLAAGEADVVFLSGAAIAGNRLGAALIPGPVVFLDPVTVMVPSELPAQMPADLGGRTICLMIGSPGQGALEAAFGAGGPAVTRLPFGEDVELLDAYNVGRCDAAVAEATTLADMRRNGGINRKRSRILFPPMALVPVIAATPTDGGWAALVFQVVNEVIAGARPVSPWRGVEAPSPAGVRGQWRAEVRAALGSYADMRERNLGKGSPLGLPAWPNAPWPDGLLTPPGPD